MFNAVLGYCGEGGVCQIKQELMGLRKPLFKTRLEQKKFKKLKIIDFYFPVCFPVSSISSTAIQTFKKFLPRLDFLCQPHCGSALRAIFL